MALTPASEPTMKSDHQQTIIAECAKLQAVRARRVTALIEAGVEIVAGDPDSAEVYYQRGYLISLCRTLADSIDRLTSMEAP